MAMPTSRACFVSVLGSIALVLVLQGCNVEPFPTVNASHPPTTENTTHDGDDEENGVDEENDDNGDDENHESNSTTPTRTPIPTEHASIVAGFVKQIAEQLIAALPDHLQGNLQEVPVAVQEIVRKTLEKPEIQAAIGKLPSDVTLANIDQILKDALEQQRSEIKAAIGQFLTTHSIQDIVTKILETPEIKAAIGQFLPDINITDANIDKIAKDALSQLLPALPADIQNMLADPSVTIGAIIKQILQTPELIDTIAKDALSQLLAALPADIQIILKDPSVTIDKLSKMLETPELKAAIGQFLPNMTAGSTEQIAKDALEQLVAALPLYFQEIAKEGLKRLGAKSQASTWTLIGTNGVAYTDVGKAP